MFKRKREVGGETMSEAIEEEVTFQDLLDWLKGLKNPLSKIIFVAKFLQAFPNQKVFSLKKMEKELKIKEVNFIYALQILEEGKAIKFSKIT